METLTNPEIDELEKAMGTSLPGLYRKLLVEIGHGDTASGKEIYHPAEIRDLCEQLFDDPSEMFNQYFPFGCDNSSHEIWVIDGRRELAASISSETVPEDWPGEAWLDYADWVTNFIPNLDSEAD